MHHPKTHWHRRYELFYQTPEGGFEDSHIVFTNEQSSSTEFFKCADINRDGFMDIIWTPANGKNNDIGTRDDFFCFVGNLDGFSIFVFSHIIDAFDSFVRDCFAKTIRFARKGRKDGYIAVRLRSNVRGQDVDGISTAAQEDFFVGWHSFDFVLESLGCLICFWVL